MERLDGKELARVVSDAVNNMGFDNNKFVHEMLREHRTLQQSFTKLCLQWMYAVAAQKETNDFDGRNEFSVAAAVKVKEALGPCGWALPLI